MKLTLKSAFRFIAFFALVLLMVLPFQIGQCESNNLVGKKTSVKVETVKRIAAENNELLHGEMFMRY
jgi:hypothetical protein